MIKRLAKVSLIIFGFFLLDLMKPFGYALSVEFILIGLVIIACNETLLVSLAAAFLSTGLRDFLIFNRPALALIEFPLICLFIHYIRAHRFFLTKQKYIFIAKAAIVILSLVVHILANSIQARLFAPFFSFQFFIQSICLYYLIDYLLVLRVDSDFQLNNR